MPTLKVEDYMKFGIVSDTHIPVRASSLPDELNTIFSGVDKIIHAGDLEDPRVLDDLAAIAPVTAVAGNMDHSVYGLPVKKSLTIGSIKIGIMHGAGGPKNNIRPFLLKQLPGHDIIIYGHTHEAFWGEEGGIWFMNPGSPTDHIFTSRQSVGLLTIDNDTFNGEIIWL